MRSVDLVIGMCYNTWEIIPVGGKEDVKCLTTSQKKSKARQKCCLCWLHGWIVIGIAYSYDWFNEEWNIPLMIGLIVGGLLLNFAGCFVLHGFGDLIDSVQDIRDSLLSSNVLPSARKVMYRYDEESLLGYLRSIKESSGKAGPAGRKAGRRKVMGFRAAKAALFFFLA